MTFGGRGKRRQKLDALERHNGVGGRLRNPSPCPCQGLRAAADERKQIGDAKSGEADDLAVAQHARFGGVASTAETLLDA